MLRKHLGFVLTICVFFFALINLSLAQDWTQLTPNGGPPLARAGATAVYDTTNNLMILFAGSTSTALLGITSLNDVWVLDSANGLGGTSSWSQLSISGNVPSVRADQAAVYDMSNNRMITFGGYHGNAGFLNDVWVLTNANGQGGIPSWTQLTTTGGPPAKRASATAIYDSVNNRMTIFGGAEVSISETYSFYDDVWILDNANGLGGTPTWTELTASGSPGTRYGSSAVYDTTDNVMILFGGGNGSGSFNDTWVLSNANGLGSTSVWSPLSPTDGPPPSRKFQSAVYDNSSNRLIIFAGTGSSGALNDVWVLNNANGLDTTPSWIQLSPSGGPPSARQFQTAVYDSDNNRMTIFGGYGGGSFLNDVWVLDNADSVPVEDWMLYATDLGDLQ